MPTPPPYPVLSQPLSYALENTVIPLHWREIKKKPSPEALSNEPRHQSKTRNFKEKTPKIETQSFWILSPKNPFILLRQNKPAENTLKITPNQPQIRPKWSSNAQLNIRPHNQANLLPVRARPWNLRMQIWTLGLRIVRTTSPCIINECLHGFTSLYHITQKIREAH